MYTKEALLDIHERSHASLKKLLDHCRALSNEELHRTFEGFGYPTVQLQFHHEIGAEEYWLGVVNGVVHADDNTDACNTIDLPETYRERVYQATREYLDGATPDELNTRRTMRTWGGGEVELVPAHIVLRTQTHFYNHQGEIMSMLRRMGKPAKRMDFPLT